MPLRIKSLFFCHCLRYFGGGERRESRSSICPDTSDRSVYTYKHNLCIWPEPLNTEAPKVKSIRFPDYQFNFQHWGETFSRGHHTWCKLCIHLFYDADCYIIQDKIINDFQVSDPVVCQRYEEAESIPIEVDIDVLPTLDQKPECKL
jgi:hypothetical protein